MVVDVEFPLVLDEKKYVIFLRVFLQIFFVSVIGTKLILLM